MTSSNTELDPERVEVVVEGEEEGEEVEEEGEEGEEVEEMAAVETLLEAWILCWTCRQ